MICWWAREFLNPKWSRSALQRMLKRRQVPIVKELAQLEKGTSRPSGKPFRDYEPGFVHVDIKYLPQMPDETERRSLFSACVDACVGIDRATRWVYLGVRQRMRRVF